MVTVRSKIIIHGRTEKGHVGLYAGDCSINEWKEKVKHGTESHYVAYSITQMQRIIDPVSGKGHLRITNFTARPSRDPSLYSDKIAYVPLTEETKHLLKTLIDQPISSS